MNDYSNFPFKDFTVAGLFALARESEIIGESDFVKAAMEAIRLGKCADQPAPMPPRVEIKGMKNLALIYLTPPKRKNEE